MFVSSVALVALASSAAMPSLGSFLHMHPPTVQPDTRVSVTLVNNAVSFRDVTVAGHTYTVLAHHTLFIKAPVGTEVFTAHHRQAAALTSLTPQMNHTIVALN